MGLINQSLASIGKIKEGVANPVDPETAQTGIFRFFPSIGFNSIWTRAILLTIQMLICYYGTTRLVLASFCGIGVLPSVGAVCVAPVRYYVWVRGVWAAGLAFCSWPAATIGTLMATHLTPDAIKPFFDRVNPPPAAAAAPSTGTGTTATEAVTRASFDVSDMETRHRRNGSAQPLTN